MNTQTTVSLVRQQCGSLFNPDDFIGLLNQALNRLIQSGRWNGSLVHTIFPTAPLGYITLPYELLSVMGISMGGLPTPVFGNQHEFIISGPGHIDETKPATGILDFINDGFATRIDPLPFSTLRIVLDLAIDIGKAFRFYGKSNGRTIYDVFGEGMNIVTTGLTTNEGTTFDRVDGIEIPVDATTGASTMIGGWTLYGVDPDGLATFLSYYYPNETKPAYARYKTGTWNITDDESNNNCQAIRLLCQRRFIPVFKETDWVIPGNIGALKASMQAVQQEDAANYDSAAPLWQVAEGILNNEVHSGRGAAKPEMSLPQAQFNGDGGFWGNNLGWGGYGN